MRKLCIFLTAVAAIFAPVSALALAGVGPRVAFEGTVQTVAITPEQQTKEMGGALTVLANNGQTVTVELSNSARILFEGKRRSSRYKPADIMVGMSVRISGYRQDANSVIGSLVTILNLEKAATFTYSGIIQNVTTDGLTIQLGNGETRTVMVTNETQVTVNYDLTGQNALSLIGKYAYLTLNPQDTTQVRIIRIAGKPYTEQ